MSIRNYIWIGLPLIFFLSCQTDLISPTASCSADSQVTSNPEHPKAGALQAVMDRYVALGIPGVTVLVDDADGTWTGSAGMADLENQVAMETCHLSKLGSVTKMMLGVLTWQYIQAGSLSLDDLISKHIPEEAARITHGDQITLGMLLSHTAGIYDIAGDITFNLNVLNNPDQDWSSERLVDMMADKPSRHDPGQGKRYSNSHMVLIGLILDRVTGRSHLDLMREQIFEPLGMENTVYYDFKDPFPLSNLSQGYIDLNNDGGSIENVTKLNTGNFGANGVYANVTDLYRFMQALMREKRFITEENLDFILDNMIEQGANETEPSSAYFSYAAIHDEFRNVLDTLPGDLHAYGHGGGDLGH
ncbi:MAG: serine hydrolase, partial [Bacteroidota bacterium]